MSLLVWKNSKLYLGGYDLSGDMNQMSLKYESDALDTTVFGQSTKRRLAGLLDIAADHKGLWQAGTNLIEDTLWSKFAVANEVMTVFPETGAAGEVGFSFKSLESAYSPGAKAGEVLAFDVSAKGVGTLIRATCLENGVKSATASGTARNLGAVSATQKLYAVMHVLAKSGTTPTLDMKIQSDDAQAFTTPLDRITFAQATDIGAQWATPVNGAITDAWWRASWTIGGTGSPSFTVVIAIAIQ